MTEPSSPDDEPAGAMTEDQTFGADEFDADAADELEESRGVDESRGLGEQPDSPLAHQRIALVGRFGGMNQREASNVIRSYGGTVVEVHAKSVDWIVVGANESPLAEAELIGQDQLSAAARGEIQVLHETDLWQRLGLVHVEQSVRQYYTPVMLADLLGVSVRVIRRWHRRGLITPVRTLHRLPYFDFREVTTARRLANWIASGASPKAIEQRLVDLIEVLPETQRPLEQLNILVEGKQVLLKYGEGLIESGGQLRFDFESLESGDARADGVAGKIDAMPREVIPIESIDEELDPLLAEAYRAEDEGEYGAAIDCLRVLLGRDGPRADWQFHLGELLYRIGDVSAARERYFGAIEVDPDFVEARCSLGIVLAEQGQYESAIAAFEGALQLHDDYPDAHYHLVQAIEAHLKNDGIDQQQAIRLRHQADEHWQCFMRLSPESPWAPESLEAPEEPPTNQAADPPDQPPS